MKKFYQQPSAEITQLTHTSFLDVSGDRIATDDFNDDYGNSLGQNPNA